MIHVSMANLHRWQEDAVSTTPPFFAPLYLACPIGTFGEGCSQNCTCLAEHESSPCEHVDGTCHCLPGYTGSSCEQGIVN